MKHSSMDSDSDWDMEDFEGVDAPFDTDTAESITPLRKDRRDIARLIEERLEQKRLQSEISYLDESWLD